MIQIPQRVVETLVSLFVFQFYLLRWGIEVSLSKGKGIPEQCNDFFKLEMEYYGICIPSISVNHRINKIHMTLQLPKVCVNFMITINAS